MNEKLLTEVRETLVAERAELKVDGAMKGLKINIVIELRSFSSTVYFSSEPRAR